MLFKLIKFNAGIMLRMNRNTFQNIGCLLQKCICGRGGCVSSTVLDDCSLLQMNLKDTKGRTKGVMFVCYTETTV